MSDTDKRPFDPSVFRITPGPISEVKTERHLSLIPVRKPSKQAYVRVHPEEDYRHPCGLFILEGDERPYMVTQPIFEAFSDDMKLVDLRLTIDRQANLIFWPVPQPPAEGTENLWNLSQREVADNAKITWLRLVSNKRLKQYESEVARGKIPEPEWPNRSMPELLEIAFSGGHIIDTINHPAIQTLLGAV